MPTPRRPQVAMNLWALLVLLAVLSGARTVGAQTTPESRPPTSNTAVEAKVEPLPPALRWPGVGHDRLKEVSLADLFLNQVVLRELHLPAERQQAIAAELNPSFQGLIRLRNRVRNVSSWHAQGRAVREQLDQALADLANAVAIRDQVVRSRLTEEENRLLSQIRLQRRGIRGLTVPEVADAIRLSPEQRENFRAILAGREAQRSTVVEHAQAGYPEFDDAHHREVTQRTVAGGAVAPGDQEYWRRYWEYHAALSRDLEAFEDGIDARLYGLLTPAQRKHFEWLLGRLVDIDQPTTGP